MCDLHEVEFAACLLEIGGPPVAFYRKNDGKPISTTGYMFAACHWYDLHIEPPPTTFGEHSLFPGWWTNYKHWLEESRRG